MDQKPLLQQILKLCRWCWLGGGIISFCVGICFATYTVVFIARSASTTGTIIRLDQVPDQENDTVNYAPAFSFKAQSGSDYTVRSSTATNPPGLKIGEQVRVIYLKDDPSSAKLDSFWQLWFVTIILCALAIFLGAASFLPLLIENRVYRQKPPSSIPPQTVSS